MGRKKSAFIFIVLILIGFLMSMALAGTSTHVLGIPTVIFCVSIAYLIQWVCFLPAYLRQTEKYFDLTGSLTYIIVIGSAVLLVGDLDGRKLLVAICVFIWASRLGYFLFSRVTKNGGDQRFNELKPSWYRFLNVWTMQAVWVVVTSSAVLAVLTTSKSQPLGVYAFVGLALWLLGFMIEVIADYQKKVFRADLNNRTKFISSGLWAYSRHPNYVGEITLWLGLSIVAIPVLSGWQFVAMLSPVFVFALIKYVSGVPMLEQKADEKWAGSSDYHAYKSSRPALVFK